MKQVLPKENNSTRGIAALLVVVIIGAATLLIAYTASFVGLASLESSFASAQGAEARSVAQGCAEASLFRLRTDPGYGLLTSPINLALGGGSCIINISDLGGSQRRLVVESEVGGYYKKIQVDITTANRILTIDSWQELEN